jgi:hypothetical protein
MYTVIMSGFKYVGSVASHVKIFAKSSVFFLKAQSQLGPTNITLQNPYTTDQALRLNWAINNK